MSEQPQEPGTALTVQERAAVALGVSELEKKLRDLVKESAEITAISNQAGYQQVHATRMTLKRQRVAIEKQGKGAREDAAEFVKAVLVEERRLITIISPEEDRLQALQDVHDAKVEAERAAREKAEAERIARIKSRIENDIRLAAQSAFGRPAAEIAVILGDVRAIPIDDWFAEFKDEAETVKVAAVGQLQRLYAAAVAHEEEQKRLAEARAELERQQAAQADRERQEQARREAEARERAHEEQQRKAQLALEERQAREHRDAEDRARAEQQRREEEEARLRREEIAAAEAESRRRLEEEQRAARLAREQEEREARERAERHQNALSEIQGIQHQILIAQTGRLGVRKGGTIECIEETLAETEAWPITEEKFGILTGSAQKAKDDAVATIRGLLEAARARAAEDAARQAELDRLAEERRAAEERERRAREDAEAKARAEREAQEAAERKQREEAEARERAERERIAAEQRAAREAEEQREREARHLAQETSDLREICVTIKTRFAHRQDAAFLLEAADTYLAAHAEEETVPA